MPALRSFSILLLLVSSPGQPSAEDAATFHYDGFLSGVKVGSATVIIERDGEHYRITGQAATNGVATFFSDWRSVFHAGGRFVDGSPKLVSYGYDERRGRRQRILELSDGMVHQISNGRKRPSRRVLDGVDLLTAFFIEPDCWERQTLHTGRHGYLIEGTASPDTRACRFQVTDEDGDRDRFVVVFDHRGTFVIPVHMSTRGWPQGTVRLREDPAVPIELAGRGDSRPDDP